jgi:hypothetical protein
MKKQNIIGGITLLILTLFLLYCVLSNIFVLYNVTKTIETNENLSKSIFIDTWIVEHEWRSNWYVIGYMFEIPGYVCSEEEKNKALWNCSNIPSQLTWEYVWFNVKTREMHKYQIRI